MLSRISFKRIISLFTSIVMILTIAGPLALNVNAASGDLSSISFTLPNNDLNVGATVMPVITAKSVDGNTIDLTGSGATILLESSDPTVCDVNTSTHEITALKSGTAVLTATVTVDGISKTANINVNVLDSASMTNAWLSKVNPDGNGAVHSLGTPHTGIVTVEYDVTPLVFETSAEALIGLFDDKAAAPTSYTSGNLSALLRIGPTDFTGNSTASWPAGLTKIVPTVGTTYHVRMEVDTTNSKHSVWVNENIVAKDYPLKNTNGNNIARMVLTSKTLNDRLKVENVWVNYTTYYTTPIETTIVSAENPETTIVDEKIPGESLDIPRYASVTMSNQTVRRMPVIWDFSNYSPTTVGLQTINGTIAPMTGVLNPSDVKVSMVLDVRVAKAEAPTADLPQGAVLAGTTVSLSSATEGAEIRYTTDGTAPTATSELYSGPITINGDLTIKAIAIISGKLNSDVATFIYLENTYDKDYEKVFDQGAYCWIGDPRSIRNVNPVTGSDKTYVGCIDINGTVKAIQHDNKTNVSQTIVIRTGFQKDDHNNPSFFVLPDGRVMIFYSYHGAEAIMYYRVTTQPDDLTTLGPEKKFTTGEYKVCYPAPFYLSAEPDSFFLCWRGVNWHPTIAKFSLPDANGDITFQQEQTQIIQSSGARPYIKLTSDGVSKISILYSTGHPDNEYPNWLYYNTLDVTTWNLLDVKGNVCKNILEGPFNVNKTAAFASAYPNVVVDNKSTSRNWAWQNTLDADGNPHLLMTDINNAKDVHSYYYVKWTGSEWRKTFLSEGGKWFHQNTAGLEKCYSGGLSMDINDLNTVYVSRPVEGKFGSVYEIIKIVIDDQGNIVSETPITKDSPKNNVRPFVVNNANKDDKYYLIWMNGDYTYWSGNAYNTAIYTTKTVDKNLTITNTKMKQFGNDISTGGLKQGDANLLTDIYNGTTEAKTVKVIISSYDVDRNLLSATTKTMTVDPQQTINLDMPFIISDPACDSVKVMFWDNFTALNPYTASVKFDTTEQSNINCTIERLNTGGSVVANASGEGSAELVTTYSGGEKLRFSAPGAKYLWVKVNNNLQETMVYSPSGIFEFVIPTGQAVYGYAYNPSIFTGSQTVTMRVASSADTSTYRNLALNPIDRQYTEEVNNPTAAHNANPITSKAVENDTVKYFPHAYANRVTRNEGAFYARNAIDGEDDLMNKNSHGNYPLQSWGGGVYPDLSYTLYFGREVEVDKLVLALRDDYSKSGGLEHDTFWEAVVVEFSDGTEIAVAPVKGGGKQIFPFKKKTTEWIRLKKLVPYNTAAAQMLYAALNEIEVWGTDHPESKPVYHSDISSTEVMERINLVNGYYQQNFALGNNFWENGVYHSGNMAAFPYLQNLDYYDFSYRCAVSHNWLLNSGNKPADGDYYVLGQSYMDLWKLQPTGSKLKSVLQVGEWMTTGTGISRDYEWIDLFYMSIPFAVELTNITGNPKYAAKAHELYLEDRNTINLYDKDDHLWYRDDRFTADKMLTPNNKKIFWSRGNGWAFAAYAKILTTLPESDPMRATYERDFIDMAAALKACQRSDGFWNSSLADPDHYGGIETSGTLAFLYGYAYGIRTGILDYNEYYPTLKKAWNAMSVQGQGLSDIGRIQYVQGVANQPGSSSKGNTNNYAYGFFMLAAAEMLQLSSDFVQPEKVTIPGDILPDPIPTDYIKTGMTATSDKAQTGNEASNLINGIWDDSMSTGSRWGADVFPQSAVITFNNPTTISKIIVLPYQSRKYTYTLYTSTDGINYTKLADSASGFNIVNGYSTHTFDPQTVKSVKITVTGVTGVSTTWVSINEILFYQ